MAIDRAGPTPMYLQIKEAIVAAVRGGDLRPGERISSESELERTYAVSRITIRQAVNALVHEGVLYRVPGKGTYVAAPKVAPLAAFTSFSENMRAQGMAPSYRLLDAASVEPPADVRAQLGLGDNDRALRLERLLLADGEPLGLQVGHYPERLLSHGRELLTPTALATASLYELFERQLGLRLGRAEETAEAAVANRKEVGLLGMPANVPVLIVRRLSFLETGDPIETVKLVFRGDRYRYRTDLLRSRTTNGLEAEARRSARSVDEERGGANRG